MGAIIIPPEYNEQLGKSLGQITGAIAQIANPFHNLQISTRNAIAADPKLAQELADMEDASPGVLEHLGLGKVGDEIAKIKPSQAQQIKKKSDEYMSNYLNTGKATNATGEEAASPIKEQLFKALTGQNTAQFGVDTAVAGNVTEEMKDKQRMAAMRTELKPEIDQLPQLDMYKAAEDFLDGKLNPRTSQAIHLTEPSAKAFDQALEGIRSERSLNMQFNRMEHANDNSIRTAAGKMASDYGLDYDTMFHLYKGDQPDLYRRLAAIRADPKNAKPGEENLTQIVNFQRKQEAKHDISALSTATTGLAGLYKGLTSKQGEDLAARVTEINLKLSAINRYRGTNYHEAIDPDGTPILYDNGKPVKNEAETLDRIETENNQIISNPNSSPKDEGTPAAPTAPSPKDNYLRTLSPTEQTAYDRINTATKNYNPNNPLQRKAAYQALETALGKVTRDRIEAADTYK